MIRRITERFALAKSEGRAASIAFLTAGDPSPDTSAALAAELLDAGVDVLELGVPFSDPLADGPTNQRAAERALAAGVVPDDVFTLVAGLRKNFSQPIVLYTYYNIIFSKGEAEYVRAAGQCGVDGLLVLDLPPEESASLREICAKEDMALIHLIAPTSGEARIQSICEAASGFIYYVSREGITGERTDLPADLKTAVERIQAYTDLPVAVGFGISSAEQVKAVAAVADGVVVGSALVNTVANHADDPSSLPRLMRKKCEALFGGGSLQK